ncbi:MAG TPA: hypothetical protein VGG39_32545 [Polyangiaceae bacterium]|jgi:MoxR-like ATPase
MRARVTNGRWVLDEPADLPEGTEVEIVTRPAPAKKTVEVYFDQRLLQYVRALLAAACSPAYSAGRAAATPKDEEELVESARSLALADGRSFARPDDVKRAAPGILRRFVSVPGALRGKDVSPDDLVCKILDATPVP